MADKKPKQVKAKITRIVTEWAIVSLDRHGDFDELIECIDEIDCDNIEILSITDIRTYHD